MSKKLDQATDINLYDINYMQLKLNVIESFDEGEFVLANRISIKRGYVSAKTQADTTSYDYVTRVHDVTIDKKRGSIAMIHGFAQCSDVFMEMALTLALNGFFVHFIDLEGSGYSSGNRINNLSIEKFHHQVSTILLQVSPDLPCFLLGHSMGGLTVNTFLGLNPSIADKLAGVLFSAPFFGIATKKINPVEKLIISGIAKVMDELVMISSLPIHKICRNK